MRQIEWLRTLKRARRYIIFGCLTLLILWFPLTWFFFGSIHPCGILNYRMRERHIKYALVDSSWNAASDFPSDSPRRHVRSPEETVKAFQQAIYALSPAECLWLSITWRWSAEEDKYLKERWKDIRRMHEQSDQRIKEEIRRLGEQARPKVQRK